MACAPGGDGGGCGAPLGSGGLGGGGLGGGPGLGGGGVGGVLTGGLEEGGAVAGLGGGGEGLLGGGIGGRGAGGGAGGGGGVPLHWARATKRLREGSNPAAVQPVGAVSCDMSCAGLAREEARGVSAARV